MAEYKQTILDYYSMMESRASAAALDAFYHPEVEQVEYPNAVTKTTAVRNLEALKAASDKGSQLLARERYEVKQLLIAGDTVVVECTWRGTLAMPAGNIPAGGEMVAHFAQVFEFKDGKIYRQRNYDCFEPF